MKVEIRPYENGEGLWINDKWHYGNPRGQADANSVAHIIAYCARQQGWNITYDWVTQKDLDEALIILTEKVKGE